MGESAHTLCDLAHAMQTLNADLSIPATKPITGLDPSWSTMPLNVLIESLVADHNRWREVVLPRLGQLLSRRAREEKRESAFALRHVFSRMCQGLLEHLHEEETILFPALLEMDRRVRQDQPRTRATFGSVRNPIFMIQREHEDDAQLWDTLQHLALLDAGTEGAPESARQLYRDLTQFAADVRNHTAIENTILFPRAVEMEKR